MGPLAAEAAARPFGGVRCLSLAVCTNERISIHSLDRCHHLVGLLSPGTAGCGDTMRER